MNARVIEDPTVLAVERALLGGILIADDIPIPPLLVEEFYSEAHRVIWTAVLAMDARGERAGLISIAEELRRRGEIERAGGDAHLALCVEQACLEFHSTTFARQIREAARSRMLRQLGLQLTAQGLSAEEVAARLEALPGPVTSAVFDPAHNWRRIVERWERGRILTGLSALDRMTAGLAVGELAAVGGRTSHGKTSLLCAIARRLAEAGTQVEIITLEESDDELVRRLVASVTGISSVRLKDGSLSPDKFAAAERAIERLQALPLRITSLETIRSLDEDSVVGVTAASAAPVVLIDHLQKVITAGESRVYGLERLLNRLHAVALKYNRVIVVAAQLSREMDAQRRPPELRDLRDSGAIEQSARQVWLIYWPCKHDRTRDVSHFEVYVAKNSGGGTGIVPLRYEASCGRFSDRDEEPS